MYVCINLYKGKIIRFDHSLSHFILANYTLTSSTTTIPIIEMSSITDNEKLLPFSSDIEDDEEACLLTANDEHDLFMDEDIYKIEKELDKCRLNNSDIAAEGEESESKIIKRQLLVMKCEILENLREINNSLATLKETLARQPPRYETGENSSSSSSSSSAPSRPPEVLFFPHFGGMRIISCQDAKNFGRVIGRDGKNLKSIYQNYRTNVGVLDTKDSQKLPILVLMKHYENKDNYYFDEATNYVLDCLK